MRASTTIASMLGLVGLAACSDPTFDVTVTFEAVAGAPTGADLRDQAATLTVSVIDATAAGAPLGHDAGCDDVAFGRVEAAVLEGARRASVAAGDGAQLSGVPRLGAKLVVVEARDRGGRRVGAGCTPWGDVEGDATVAVAVEAVPTVRVFSREETIGEPAPMRLVVTAAWDDLLPLGGRHTVAELHTPAGVVEMPVADTSPNGLTRTPDFALDVPGPAQTLIRVRWADEVLRVPAFVMWPTIAAPTALGPRVTLATNPTAPVAPAWVTGRLDGGEANAWAAAAIEAPSAGAEELRVVFYRQSEHRLQTLPTVVAVPGARALAIWNGRVVTVLASGWQRLGDMGLEAVGTAEGSGAATAIVVIPDCDDAVADDGLLVRRTIGSGEAYRAYTAPGVPAPASHPLAVLAGQLDEANQLLVGSGCMTLDDGSAAPREVRVALSRGVGLGLNAWLATGDHLVLPGVPTVASYRQDGKSFAAGVEGTIHGPQVSSYKLTELAFGDGTLTGFVTTGELATELATVPVSLDVADLDDDGALDVAAVFPSLAGPRLQVNLGRTAAGEPLASISPALSGGRAATNPLVRWQQVDDVGHPELVVLSDEGLDVYCIDVKPVAGGHACASAP